MTTTSSFVAWAACHGVDVDGARQAEMELRFDGVGGEAIRLICEGFRI